MHLTVRRVVGLWSSSGGIMSNLDNESSLWWLWEVHQSHGGTVVSGATLWFHDSG